MNVVVTGSEGFLGRALVTRLVNAGLAVVAVDRIPSREASLPGVMRHQADLADSQGLLPPTVDPMAPFTLVHLAWDMRRFDGFSNQAQQVRQFAGMVDYWGARGLHRLLVMGSAEEYGSRAGQLIESDAPVLPLSAYGWAKRSTRDLAQSWSIHTGRPVTWLRPFIIYGPGQRGDLLIPSAIAAAQQKQKTAFTDGRQCRDFVWVDDVVEAIFLSIKKELPGFQEFNLGRGEATPVAEILMTIAKHYGVESLFELGMRPRRPGEPEMQIADPERALAQLGWKASVRYDEGLRRLLSSPVEG
jgi:UDP-glucuronate decarboxylase